MKTLSHAHPTRAPISTTIARRMLLVLALAGTAASLHAQGLIPSGQISGEQASPGVYDYTLTISDGSGATTPIGSFWYAWVPGAFYLPSTPTSASGPTGWSASIVGKSIQFSADSAANDIAPGTSRTFDYVASFSPAQLAAAPNGGLSVAYGGAIESSPSLTFSVQAVPEPPALTLLSLGLGGLCLAGRRKAV